MWGGGLLWWPQDQVSADHVVLSASSGCDDKLSPAARVKISNSKSETVIHSQKRGPTPQASTWDENLPQVKSSPLQGKTTLGTANPHSCQILVQRKTWKKREFQASFSLLSSPPDSGSGTEDGRNTSPSWLLHPLWSYGEGAHVGQGWVHPSSWYTQMYVHYDWWPDWLTYWKVRKKGRRSHQSFAVTDVNFCALTLSHQIKEPRLQRAAIFPAMCKICASDFLLKAAPSLSSQWHKFPFLLKS